MNQPASPAGEGKPLHTNQQKQRLRVGRYVYKNTVEKGSATIETTPTGRTYVRLSGGQLVRFPKKNSKRGGK